MTAPFFFPKSPPVPLQKAYVELDGVRRELDVFVWQDRLVAHEHKTGLWWGTLDTHTPLNTYNFWNACYQQGRIGRLFSLHRGFESALSANNARLLLEPRWFDVIVAQDNSGLARMHGEAQWHTFSPGVPRRVRKPLAHRPSIWSPLFHSLFAVRGMAPLTPIFTEEAMAHVSPFARQLWQEGTTHQLVRLVAAAQSEGWVQTVFTHMSLSAFWQSVLERQVLALETNKSRLQIFGKISRDLPFVLPTAMARSPEVATGGTISLSLPTQYRGSSMPANFQWHGYGVTVGVKFWPGYDSHHERLEARLELRNWLAQFFPMSEVKSWFDSV